MNQEKSILPIIFYIVAVLTFGFGVMYGYTVAEPEIYFLGSHNWQLTFIIWASTIISTLGFFATGKIIEMLVKIYNKLDELKSLS